jgi:hypothetical protein
MKFEDVGTALQKDEGITNRNQGAARAISVSYSKFSSLFDIISYTDCVTTSPSSTQGFRGKTSTSSRALQRVS